MNNVELYWNDDHTEYAVLISYGYGAGWSSWNEPELAYDKRVVEFWLSHKNNKDWMRTVNDFETSYQPASIAYKEAQEFFESIGYSPCPYMGGFADIALQWIPVGIEWRINEYDGAESIECCNKIDWNCF